MRDRHADLADLALSQRVVAVVTGLGGQIEGDREPGLTLGEVLAIERVGIVRVGMTGIGAENPGLVACPGRAGRCLAHGRLAALRHCAAQHTPGTLQKVAVRTHTAPRLASGHLPPRGAPATLLVQVYNAPARPGAPRRARAPGVALGSCSRCAAARGAPIRASV